MTNSGYINTQTVKYKSFESTFPNWSEGQRRFLTHFFHAKSDPIYSLREMHAAFKLLKKAKKALKMDKPLGLWRLTKKIVKNIYEGIPENCGECTLLQSHCYDDCIHGTSECLQNLERHKIIEVVVE